MYILPCELQRFKPVLTADVLPKKNQKYHFRLIKSKKTIYFLRIQSILNH